MATEANQPIAKFHFPDFTRHLQLNLLMLQMIRHKPEYFRDGVTFASVYGAFPPALWNGGRPMGGMNCSEAVIRQILHAFNSEGVPVRYTFTNPMLTEEHLRDPFCNMLMRLGNNGLNEVIVFSELLENYIREKYPKYKLTSSTCKRITDPEKVKEELNKDYHVVVLDYDLCNQFELLDTLPHKEKIELLTDSPCIPHCARRSREYEVCGMQQIVYNEHLKKHPNKPFRMLDYADYSMADYTDCPALYRSPAESKALPHHISPELIWDWYLPHGFQQFKISGRGSSTLSMIEHYVYYLVKPEAQNEVWFLIVSNLEKNGFLKVL